MSSCIASSEIFTDNVFNSIKTTVQQLPVRFNSEGNITAPDDCHDNF